MVNAWVFLLEYHICFERTSLGVSGKITSICKYMFRISQNLKAFEAVNDQSFSEAVEDFSNRAKKLEIDFLRYETTCAIS